VNNWLRSAAARATPTTPKIRATGAAQNFIGNVSFKPTWGSVVEAEFFPLQSWGIKVRYVSEKVQGQGLPRRAATRRQPTAASTSNLLLLIRPGLAAGWHGRLQPTDCSR
jgi:hypothetical protein